MFIVLPAPAALATPWSPIDVTVTLPPLMLMLPVKELELLERVQRLPDPVDIDTVPLPLEISPVISLVLVGLAVRLVNVRVFAPEVAALIFPPMRNLLVALGAWLLIVNPPYIKRGALMVMVVLFVARVERIWIVEVAVMFSALPLVVPIV